MIRNLVFAIITALSGLAAVTLPVTADEGYVPLVWDDGARALCYQHIGQTREGILNKQPLEVSTIKGTACASLPQRPKICAAMGPWREGIFMPDGTCPGWFIQTSNWRASDFGKTPGWSFSAQAQTEGEPLLMTLANNAATDLDPCVHREVNFNYNFPRINFIPVDGHPASFGDFDDILFTFRARVVHATSSRCEKLKRNFVKLSFIVRWYDESGPKRKYKWQSSIAVLLYDKDDFLMSGPARLAELQDAVAFDNNCTVHGLYKTAACMLSLKGTEIGLPEMTGDFREYRISLTQLMERYRSQLSPGDGTGLKLEQAEIKTVQVISAVNGGNITFQLQNPRLLGTRK